MGRKLKFHEQKLLKRHNFLSYKRDTNIRELQVLRRYHIEDRSDYLKYSRMVGAVQAVAHRLKALDPADPVRISVGRNLLEKLYAKGLIPLETSLEAVDKLTVSAFCRRRLPVVMTRVKMAETVKAATTLVHHGHVRIGPEIIKDPAFFLTRSMEDHLTWVDASKIKRILQSYNDKLDDYDLLNA
jgi:U3 small nucleolar ribonucleoprotein protein IMP3